MIFCKGETRFGSTKHTQKPFFSFAQKQNISFANKTPSSSFNITVNPNKLPLLDGPARKLHLGLAF